MRTIDVEKHQCLIRWILALTASNGKESGSDFIGRVEKRHGKPVADRLREDCRDQWAKGNRGAKGDWR